MTRQITSARYPDGEYLSPDGSLRLLIEGARYRCEQHGKLVWERARPRWGCAGSPQYAYVGGAGWAALLYPDHELFILKPTGHRIARWNVLQVLRRDPASAGRIQFSTAARSGNWDLFPNGYFLEMDGRPVFCLRTWWGRRFLIRLSDRALLPDEGALPDVRAAERDLVLARLREGVEWLRSREIKSFKDRDHPTFRNALAAVHLAGRAGVQDVIRPLRDLEAFPISSHTESTSSTPSPILVYALRRRVQQALLRLGENPSATGAYQIDLERDTPEERPTDWVTRVQSISADWTLERVVEAVGPPHWASDAWEYDHISDEGASFTFRMVWDGKVVASVERMAPQWESLDRDGPGP